MAEWRTVTSYETRVANLQDGSGGGGSNADFFLNDLVRVDGGRNTMSGQGNDDYFWGLSREITDLDSSEIRDKV